MATNKTAIGSRKLLGSLIHFLLATKSNGVRAIHSSVARASKQAIERLHSLWFRRVRTKDCCSCAKGPTFEEVNGDLGMLLLCDGAGFVFRSLARSLTVQHLASSVATICPPTARPVREEATLMSTFVATSQPSISQHSSSGTA